MIDSRKIVDIPLPQFSLILKKTHLIKASFTWLVYISLCFLLFLFFPEISSTCNSPRLHLSVIIFLIPLLPSSSVKCHSVILYWSLKQKFHSIIQQKFPLHYVGRYLETLKVCSLGLQVASNTGSYFRGRISLQSQECGARFITVKNQPVPIPSTISFACSQANHFLFSTS